MHISMQDQKHSDSIPNAIHFSTSTKDLSTSKAPVFSGQMNTDKNYSGDAWCAKAKAALADGELAGAIEILNTALKECRDLNPNTEFATVLLYKAFLHYLDNTPDTGVQYLQIADGILNQLAQDDIKVKILLARLKLYKALCYFFRHNLKIDEAETFIANARNALKSITTPLGDQEQNKVEINNYLDCLSAEISLKKAIIQQKKGLSGQSDEAKETTSSISTAEFENIETTATDPYLKLMALKNLAILHYESKNYDKAITYFDKLIRFFSSNSTAKAIVHKLNHREISLYKYAYFCRGFIGFNQREWQNALQHFEVAGLFSKLKESVSLEGSLPRVFSNSVMCAIECCMVLAASNQSLINVQSQIQVLLKTDCRSQIKRPLLVKLSSEVIKRFNTNDNLSKEIWEMVLEQGI